MYEIAYQNFEENSLENTNNEENTEEKKKPKSRKNKVKKKVRVVKNSTHHKAQRIQRKKAKKQNIKPNFEKQTFNKHKKVI